MYLPPLTKLYKTICEFELYKINAKEKRHEEKTLKNVYEEELESHDNIVITSMVVEASMESGFQFWFQTVFILPTIILSLINVWGDA